MLPGSVDMELPAGCIPEALPLYVWLGIVAETEVHGVHRQLHRSAPGDQVAPFDHFLVSLPSGRQADL